MVAEDVGEEPYHWEHLRFREFKVERDNVSWAAARDCSLTQIKNPSINITVVRALQEGMQAILTVTRGAEGASWAVLLLEAMESRTCWKDIVEKFEQETGLLRVETLEFGQEPYSIPNDFWFAKLTFGREPDLGS